MKPPRLIALGTWMVEHLTPGLANEALCGDLVEEMEGGRSAGWFWRQVCFAIAAGVASRLHEVALPLIYCAAWTALYPGWRFLSNAVLIRLVPGGLGSSTWPWSALIPLGCGLLPALAFVWLGMLVYIPLRPGTVRDAAARRLLWGMSASVNVLLVSTPLLLWHFRRSAVDLHALMRSDFYSAFHLLWISIPLALSLLAGLLFCTSDVVRFVHRRRQLRRQSV